MLKLLDNPLKVLSNPLSALSEIEKVIKEIEQNINTLDKVLRGVTGDVKLNNKAEEKKSDDDFMSHLMKGLREIELAKIKVPCPTVQNIIDEILLFAEEKLEDLKWVRKDLVKTAEEVLAEEGVEDWESLNEEEKRLIKEKIKQRLRGGS